MATQPRGDRIPAARRRGARGAERRWRPGQSARRSAAETLAFALLGSFAFGACTHVRPGEEPSDATNLDERIAELEFRVERDRAVVEDFVSSTAPADEKALREVAWRLPENTRTLRELRGDDAEDADAREGSPEDDPKAPAASADAAPAVAPSAAEPEVELGIEVEGEPATEAGE